MWFHNSSHLVRNPALEKLRSFTALRSASCLLFVIKMGVSEMLSQKDLELQVTSHSVSLSLEKQSGFDMWLNELSLEI